jgi:hypothetical protein
MAGLVYHLPAVPRGDGAGVKIDFSALACLIVVACLIIMTIALGHLAWGW